MVENNCFCEFLGVWKKKSAAMNRRRCAPVRSRRRSIAASGRQCRTKLLGAWCSWSHITHKQRVTRPLRVQKVLQLGLYSRWSCRQSWYRSSNWRGWCSSESRFAWVFASECLSWSWPRASGATFRTASPCECRRGSLPKPDMYHLMGRPPSRKKLHYR